MRGRPAGLYVLRKEAVGWRPAMDVNRLVGVLENTADGADHAATGGRLLRARWSI